MNTVTSREPITLDVWWEPGSNHINLTTSSALLVNDVGMKPGLWVAVSRTPLSANYHPGNWNRLARFLSLDGQLGPDIIPMHPRQLTIRDRVIAMVANNDTRYK